MKSRHLVLLAALTLAVLPELSVSAVAQTVENAPTNCCTEIYWAGWESGRLQSVANYATPAYRQLASRHMQRLSATLEAANQTCCRFCEAWSAFPEIQSGIQARADDLLASPHDDALETRRAFHEWAATWPVHLLEGLNRCDLEEGSPCKWLDLVDCARAYFELGVQLGYAMHALAAAGDGVEAGLIESGTARQDGLDRLARADGLLTALRGDPGEPGSAAQRMRCDYFWQEQTGAQRLLSELLGEPDRYTAAQLAAQAAEAQRLVLRLLLDGDPDLGIPPCPIGSHDHAECEFAEEHGHAAPVGQGN